MRQAAFGLALTLLAGAASSTAGCTPGAATLSGGGRGPVAGAVIVQVSLLKFSPSSSAYGTVAGYSPNPVTVPVGAVVQFVNDDNFVHTASSVGSAGFPTGDPLSSAAVSPSGSDLANAAWSTGNIPGGGTSQAFTASTAGTYYFGCFYHYGSPMRGVIIVQ
jgi:plastocyanin